MKKVLLLALLGIAMTSCSDETIVNNYDVNVENVTVSFGTKSILTESSGLFKKSAPIEFNRDYTHVLPTSFKAYFVSNEDLGQYKKGDVIKVIDVVTGMQNITIPKLAYIVYTTNHIKNNNSEYKPYAWYTWEDSIEQLPVTSSEILLFGKNTIDYKTVTTGVVSLNNYHSAIMIANNSAISSSPFFNTGNVNYNLVANDKWYLLYIKNEKTSTQVTLSFQSASGNVYQLDKDIITNKIYQYTFQAVGDIEGNLNVITVPLEDGLSELITVL